MADLISGRIFILGDEPDLVIGQHLLVEGQAQFDASLHQCCHRGDTRCDHLVGFWADYGAIGVEVQNGATERLGHGPISSASVGRSIAIAVSIAPITNEGFGELVD
jgi:hypothetical protein